MYNTTLSGITDKRLKRDVKRKMDECRVHLVKYYFSN